MERRMEIKKDFNMDLEMAHKYSSNHKSALQYDHKCGCFNCLKIFSPDEIKFWIHDKYDDTATCPYCMIDSVIGESSGYPITKEFLGQMQEYWFQCGTFIWYEDEGEVEDEKGLFCCKR